MGQLNREELVKELLDVPDSFKVVALITIGAPDETPVLKERKSLESIVSWGKYGSMTR